MRTRIDVTKEDIAAGLREECESCPIALACLRAGLVEPRVYDDSISYGDVSVRQIADLPRKAKAFIERFDAGQPVEPFSFSIDDEWCGAEDDAS